MGNDKLNNDSLNKVQGGVIIINPANEEDLEKKDLERQLKILQDLVKERNRSYAETMELMSKIVDLQNKIDDIDNRVPIIKK